MRARAAFLIVLSSLLTPQAGHASTPGEWTDLGLRGGKVSSLIPTPSDANGVYGIGWGGVFKSFDAGATWHSRDVGIHDWIRNISVARSAPSVLFAASAGGVYRSGDNGENWSLLPGTAGRILETLATDSSGVHVIAATGLGGIRSNDGGATWSAIALPRGVEALAFDPNNPLGVYAGSYWKSLIYHSSDGGTTWTPEFTSYTHFRQFAFDPWQPSVVYAATENGVVRRDGGTYSGTWSAIATPFNNIHSIAFDPTNERGIYITGSEGAFRTRTLEDDGGWSQVSGLPESDDYPAVTVMAGGHLLVGTEGQGPYGGTGLVASTPSTGWRAMTTWDVAVDRDEPRFVYAATMGQGLLRSIDGGTTWTETAFPGDCVQEVEVQGSTVWATNDHQEIWRSRDRGDSWTKLTSPGTFQLVASPTSTNRLYAATGGSVSRSDDGGDSWTKSSVAAESLDIDPNDPNLMYAGGDNTVSRSTDAGVSWTKLTTNFPTSYVDVEGNQWPFIIYAVGIDPAHPDHVYVGTNGNGAFATFDGGTTWEAVNTGLWTPHGLWDVRSFLFDSGDGSVYMSMGAAGFARSTDGKTWNKVDAGIDNENARLAYRLVSDGGSIYAATFGGVWRFGLTDAVAPVVTFSETKPISVLSYAAPSNPITTRVLYGNATDDHTGIRSVIVSWTPPGAGTTSGEALVSCSDSSRRSCTWSALAPTTPGLYSVTVRTVDRAGNASATVTTEALVLV